MYCVGVGIFTGHRVEKSTPDSVFESKPATMLDLPGCRDEKCVWSPIIKVSTIFCFIILEIGDEGVFWNTQIVPGVQRYQEPALRSAGQKTSKLKQLLSGSGGGVNQLISLCRGWLNCENFTCTRCSCQLC